MAFKHVLKLSSINEFLDDNKIIKRGENALESNHVKTMLFDAELMVIRGEVHASMKDKLYHVEITLNRSGDIQSATCACPRGIKCHHIATLALFGHYNISVTDAECTWNAPKSSSTEVKTAEEMYPSKPYTAVRETLSDTAINKLRSQLNTFGNTVGFTWLLKEESNEETSKDLNIPNIDCIISSQDFLQSANKIGYLKVKCALDDNQIKKIAAITTGQVSNDLWYVVRKSRITASNFGAVISACHRGRYTDSLFKSLMGAYNLDGIKSIQWGRIHEKDGIDFLKTNLGLDIQQTGIWLNNSGFLGASPDGLVGEDAIIEIKCPYTIRSDNLSEKLKDNEKYILFYNSNGQTCINTDHKYYHQIQGNLHILKRSKCYLCVWTLKEAITVLVEVDPSWEKYIPVLENFFSQQYLPKLLER